MILDTNALSALVDGDPRVDALLPPAPMVGITAIGLGEFRFGIAQSRRRVHYEGWLSQFLTRYWIVPVDQGTSSAYAELRHDLKRAGTPIPVNDLWIAALAAQHNVPILSRDRHFDLVRRIKRIPW